MKLGRTEQKWFEMRRYYESLLRLSVRTITVLSTNFDARTSQSLGVKWRSMLQTTSGGNTAYASRQLNHASKWRVAVVGYNFFWWSPIKHTWCLCGIAAPVKFNAYDLSNLLNACVFKFYQDHIEVKIGAFSRSPIVTRGKNVEWTKTLN